MQATLTWVSFGTGVLVAVLSFLLPALSGAARKLPSGRHFRTAFLLAAASLAAAFAFTLPKESPWPALPFSTGQGMGWGLLIGGIAALLSAYGSSRIGRGEATDGQERAKTAYWPYPTGISAALALAAVSLVLGLFAGDPVDALAGCALGFVGVALVFRLSEPRTAENGGDTGDALEPGALLAAILATSVALAVYRFGRPELREWWAYPLVLTGFWLLGRAVSYAAVVHPATRAGWRLPLLLSAMAAVLFTLLPGWLLATRLEHPQAVVLQLASGLLTAALLLWLALAAEPRGEVSPRSLQLPALAVLLVIFLVVLNFRLLAGFGVAVALIAAWALVSCGDGLADGRARLPMRGIAIGVCFVLLRLFLERSGFGAGEEDLATHYTLIGAMVGALLPFVLAALSLSPGVGRALVLGLLASLSPILLLALWGPNAALGLTVGLIVAQGLGVMLLPVTDVDTRWATWHSPTGLLALIMGLAIVQFGRSLSFLSDMPRGGKVVVAIGIAAAVIIWGVAMALVQLRREAARAGGGSGA